MRKQYEFKILRHQKLQGLAHKTLKGEWVFRDDPQTGITVSNYVHCYPPRTKPKRGQGDGHALYPVVHL